MRYQGKIIKWNDAKGFGFVQPNGSNKEVFLHISSFKSKNRRPQISQRITYDLTQDASGRDKAHNVSCVTHPQSPIDGKKTELNQHFILFMGLVSIFILERIFSGALPFSYLFIYLLANLMAFLYYYMDKTAALKGRWRKSESSLHILSLLGGWPGAYIAQKTLRHKNRKTSFQLTYKVTVAIHCSIITISAIPQLQQLVKSHLLGIAG